MCCSYFMFFSILFLYYQIRVPNTWRDLKMLIDSQNRTQTSVPSAESWGSKVLCPLLFWQLAHATSTGIRSFAARNYTKCSDKGITTFNNIQLPNYLPNQTQGNSDHSLSSLLQFEYLHLSKCTKVHCVAVDFNCTYTVWQEREESFRRLESEFDFI
jgi:hypothetical protein